jgi:hypothetical protein
MAGRGRRVIKGVVIGLLALAGCAAPSSDAQRWAEARGGIVDAGLGLARARAALARIEACGAIERPLTVAVLDSDAPGAYGWRTGTIFVTHGLVDLADDDELAAAIAHEAGHLLVDGHVPRTAALDGCRRACGAGAGEDAEIAADRMGVELLRVSAVPGQALERLLGKLASSPGTTSTCRGHLNRRIAALRAPHDHAQ